MLKVKVVGGVPHSSDPAGWNEPVVGRKQVVGHTTGLYSETQVEPLIWQYEFGPRIMIRYLRSARSMEVGQRQGHE